MRVRKIVYLSIGVLLAAALLFGGYRLYHKLRYGEQLTVQNDTSTVVLLLPSEGGDTTFGESVSPHSRKRIDADSPLGHPDSIDIEVRGNGVSPGYTERCTWATARRHQPLVVTNYGASCGERTFDQPVSPLQ